MKALYCFVIIFCSSLLSYAQHNTLQLSKSNIVPVIDGVIIEEEWADAQKIQLQRTPEYKVKVLVKYDSQYIYVAFTNLSEPEMTRLNTEILVQTIEAENEWDENCYWFHASYSNCFSRGEYYNWEFCAENPSGWKANTFPFKNGNNNIEFKISFSKLQLALPTPGTKLKVAFKVSSVDEKHTYWPKEASIKSPDTWGTITFN